MEIEFLSNPQTLLSVVSIGLLVVAILISLATLWLTWRSHLSQKRGDIRDGLEEIDDIEIDEHMKIKPIFHSFDYSCRNPKTKVLLKLYEPGTEGVQASFPKKPSRSLFKDEKQVGWTESQLKNVNGFEEEVESLQSEKYGVLLTLNTENPVIIRKWTNRASVYLLLSIQKLSPFGKLPPHKRKDIPK